MPHFQTPNQQVLETHASDEDVLENAFGVGGPQRKAFFVGVNTGWMKVRFLFFRTESHSLIVSKLGLEGLGYVPGGSQR